MLRMFWMIIHAGAPPMGPRISPPGRWGGRRPPRRPKVLKTLQFPLFWRPAEQLCPLSEISDKVPIRGQIVCFSIDISMVGASICSRLQPQPHCGRGTVRNHPLDHPSCIAALHACSHCMNRKCRMQIQALMQLPPPQG